MPLNDKGWEEPDPTPVAIPLRYQRPPTRMEELQAMMRGAAAFAQDNGMESPEEAEDFDVGDDYDPQSPHEFEARGEEYNQFLLDRISAAAHQPEADGDRRGTRRSSTTDEGDEHQEKPVKAPSRRRPKPRDEPYEEEEPPSRPDKRSSGD